MSSAEYGSLPYPALRSPTSLGALLTLLATDGGVNPSPIRMQMP